MIRSTFLYMEPKKNTPNFSQCAICKMFLAEHGLCSLHGKDVKIKPTMACNLWVSGGPAKETELQHVAVSVTPETSGLVDRQVRCENCEFFRAEESECLLFEILGIEDHIVKPQGCCNGFHSDDDKTEKKEVSKRDALKKYIR